MSKVAITGAAGGMGRATLSALERTEHEVLPVTHREHEEIDGVVADITDPESIEAALCDQDIVIHLAGEPDPDAEWERVRTVNIDGTRNVYEAAVANDLERVVFASTNHVTQMHTVPHGESWEGMVDDPDPIRIGDEVRPDSYYAISKVAGEAASSFYTDRYDLKAIDLRIGWFLRPEELVEKFEKTDLGHYARAMWLSPRDWRHMTRRVVEADLPDRHITVNCLSQNTHAYLSVVEARRTLDYRPQDNSHELLDDA